MQKTILDNLNSNFSQSYSYQIKVKAPHLPHTNFTRFFQKGFSFIIHNFYLLKHVEKYRKSLKNCPISSNGKDAAQKWVPNQCPFFC